MILLICVRRHLWHFLELPLSYTRISPTKLFASFLEGIVEKRLRYKDTFPPLVFLSLSCFFRPPKFMHQHLNILASKSKTLTRICMMTWSMFGRCVMTVPWTSRLQCVKYTICPALNLDPAMDWKPGPMMSDSLNSLTFLVMSKRTE